MSLNISNMYSFDKRKSPEGNGICPFVLCAHTSKNKCNNIKLKETWNTSYWQKPNFSVL